MSTTSRFSAVTRRAALQGVSLAALVGMTSACTEPDPGLGSTTRPTTPRPKSTASVGPPVPDSAKASVAFTFTVSDAGDRVKNPYIAVWIEAPDGVYLATVALWYQRGEGDVWLDSLVRWYSESQGDTTVSSGTQVPGSYTVDWDAKVDGSKIGAGDYFVCVEAAREHGPYELVRGPVTMGKVGGTTELEPQGELTSVAVTWSV